MQNVPKSYIHLVFCCLALARHKKPDETHQKEKTACTRKTTKNSTKRNRDPIKSVLGFMRYVLFPCRAGGAVALALFYKGALCPVAYLTLLITRYRLLLCAIAHSFKPSALHSQMPFGGLIFGVAFRVASLVGFIKTSPAHF